MFFQKLSLRYKILLLISFLLCSAIFIYLSIAVNLFNSDKLAYIYDSNASLTNSLASESETVIDESLKSIELIASSVASNKSMANRLFSLDKTIVFAQVFEARSFFNSKNPRILFQAAKNEYLNPYDLKTSYYTRILKAEPIGPEQLKSSKYFLRKSELEGGAPVLTFATAVSSKQNGKDDMVAIVHLRNDRLLDIFSRSELYSSFLVNANGKVLIQNSRSEKEDNASNAIISQFQNSSVRTGVLEYEKNSEEVISSYTKIDKYGLLVVTEISKDIAFLASKRLVEKSVQFAFLILLVALIVSIFFAKQLTAALRLLYQGTVNVAKGDFNAKVDVVSHDEIGSLANSFNIMSDKIQELLIETREKALLEKELDTAKMVQSTFFPEQTSKVGPLAISGKYQPATQCGGDWWGHVQVPGGGHYVFIADAMGHGVPAALVTAMAYSSCQTLASLIQSGAMKSHSPSEILSEFNKILFDAVRGTISMTFFAAYFDFDKGIVRYANAGHNFPILFPVEKGDDRAGRVSKSFAKISDRPPINMSLKGTPLGVARDAQFDEGSMNIRAGDKFFFFTDGIIECTDPEGQMWGRKTLIKKILEMVEDDVSTIQQSIFQKAFQFFNGQPIDDDLTVVVMEIDKDYQSRSVSAAS